MIRLENRLPYAAATKAYADLIRTPPVGPSSPAWVGSAEFPALEQAIMGVLASQHYPQPFSPERASIDQVLAIVIHEHLTIGPAQASEISFWRYLNCRAFPWLVWWRWARKGTLPNPERFLSPTRNYLGNLWWRAELFTDQDNASEARTIPGLLEDDFIGLLERPAMRGYRSAIQALAREIARYRRNHSGEAANDLIRAVVVRFRAYAASHEILALDEGTVEGWIRSQFTSSGNIG